MSNTKAYEIQKLKEEKNAVILAHNYQIEEVQDAADFVGDSYDLSKKAASSEADVIIFCGVHFMAETAFILSPDKTIILPEINAGCPLADTIDHHDVLKLRHQYPQAAVVCYINSSAAVKAVSDASCTSSNAVRLVNSLPEKQIIFIPDENLGTYVSKQTDKEIIIWKGHCNTHHRVTADDVKKVKEIHPEAPILVHPECRPEVLEKADFIGGTAAIKREAKKSKHNKIIIGTEMGMLYPLKKDNPEKEFFLLSQKMICPNMKLITLDSIYRSLKNMEPIITVPEETASKALQAVNKMLTV